MSKFDEVMLSPRVSRTEIEKIIVSYPILLMCMKISMNENLSWEEMLMLCLRELYKHNQELEEILIRQEAQQTRAVFKDWA